MPELPEVETIRKIVERELTGRTLTGLELTLPKLVRDSPLPDLGLLVGRTMLGADRRAKVLVTHWSDGLSVLTHFKLAGQLARAAAGRHESCRGSSRARSRGTISAQGDPSHPALRRDNRLLQRHQAVRLVAADAN